jgi:hypothetical protein
LQQYDVSRKQLVLVDFDNIANSQILPYMLSKSLLRKFMAVLIVDLAISLLPLQILIKVLNGTNPHNNTKGYKDNRKAATNTNTADHLHYTYN